MTAARKLLRISPEDYLAGELESPIKHEYLNGIVYAMAGARNSHNKIVGNAFLAIGFALRGSKCRPWNSDTKVRVRTSGELRFYYPDASVICNENRADNSYH